MVWIIIALVGYFAVMFFFAIIAIAFIGAGIEEEKGV